MRRTFDLGDEDGACVFLPYEDPSPTPDTSGGKQNPWEEKWLGQSYSTGRVDDHIEDLSLWRLQILPTSSPDAPPPPHHWPEQSKYEWSWIRHSLNKVLEWGGSQWRSRSENLKTNPSLLFLEGKPRLCEGKLSTLSLQSAPRGGKDKGVALLFLSVDGTSPASQPTISYYKAPPGLGLLQTSNVRVIKREEASGKDVTTYIALPYPQTVL